MEKTLKMNKILKGRKGLLKDVNYTYNTSQDI